MEHIVSHSVRIECSQGNITRQNNMEAIVNAANAELSPGGGVAGAVHKAAGPGLYQEAKQYAPIQPGEAVVTSAYDLPNDYVIHCLGPRYGIDTPESKLLSSCYENVLSLAEDTHIRSLAFPAISVGAFGYPIEDAARIALTTVQQHTPRLQYLGIVRFVLYSGIDKNVFTSLLST